MRHQRSSCSAAACLAFTFLKSHRKYNITNNSDLFGIVRFDSVLVGCSSSSAMPFTPGMFILGADHRAELASPVTLGEGPLFLKGNLTFPIVTSQPL